MTVFDLYSKKQKILRGEVPDVYVYSNLPDTLRVQIIHIWFDTLGSELDYYNHRGDVEFTYKLIVDTLCREYGLFTLPTAEKHKYRMYLTELANYLLQESDTERQLDIIDLSFKAINVYTRNYTYMSRDNSSELADNAINELNTRFKEWSDPLKL